MNSRQTVLSRRDFARITGFSLASVASGLPVLAARSSLLPSSIVRLDSNENPYGPSPAALDAIRDSLMLSSRYPDEQEERLAADLARLHSVASDQILLGNGSGELLKLATLAFTGPERSTVVAQPTFEAIAGHARASNADVVEVRLTDGYRHDLARMLETRNAGLVYICNPNNPTASITPKEEIRSFLGAVSPQTIVLVDEAYHHYVESNRYESVIPLVNSQANLVVLRTFSKIYGMAGLRCGYAVGRRETIERMGRHRPWNNMNLVALVAARASLADTVHVQRNRRRNSQTRREVVRRLDLLGFETIPSEANFVMTDIGREVRPVIAALRDQKVHVGRFFPALPTHLRVTIGQPNEMERFLAALQQVAASHAA